MAQKRTTKDKRIKRDLHIFFLQFFPFPQGANGQLPSRAQMRSEATLRQLNSVTHLLSSARNSMHMHGLRKCNRVVFVILHATLLIFALHNTKAIGKIHTNDLCFQFLSFFFFKLRTTLDSKWRA